MSQKTYDQLIASFPDNNLGLITPLNMRDYVDSVELKYTNFVVVKTGQPNGNAFPAPASQVITLAANTCYVINGAVTVLGELKMGSNTVIMSLNNDPLVDILTLDATLTSKSLIRADNADNVSFRLLNVGLTVGAASSKIFGCTNTNNTYIFGCRFNSAQLGTWAGATGTTLFNYTRTSAITSALTLSGSFSSTRFIDFSTGTTAETVDVVDFGASTHTNLRIEDCYYSVASAKFLFKGLVTGSCTKGKFFSTSPRSTNVGNVAPTALGSATNFYFHGVEEYADSAPVVAYALGGLVFNGNTTSTVSTGAGNYIKVVSGGADVLFSQSYLFTRSATMQLTLTGLGGTYWFTVMGGLRRATGSSIQQYYISVYVNGSQISNGGQLLKGAISTYNTADMIGISGFLTLATNDTIEMRVASISTSVDSVMENMVWTMGSM